jgi:D-glucuronyl C5-epimerase C-terminus
MKRAAAVSAAAALALCAPAVASAFSSQSALLAHRGITHALAQHWLKPADAKRYGTDVNLALHDVARLPKLRGRIVAAQLRQITVLWDSYTSPRALALFSQLEQNLAYLETHRVPARRVDTSDDDGVVYRWFPGLGLEFHPLASFGALNNVAAQQDADATRTLATALLERAIPRGSRLIWEYAFPFGRGRPPWASGMAQAVAAQSLARAGALLQDDSLVTAASRAYAAVPGLVLRLPSGPWIRLYGFGRELVLNAQLQAILSLTEYGETAHDAAATALAQGLSNAARALLPRFDTGDWSLYDLGGAYAPREYQTYVTDELAKLAARTQDPFWVAAARRFHDYLYAPPQVTLGAVPPALYPQPSDGYLDDAPIPVTLSQRASVTLAIAGTVRTWRLGPGAHTLTWTPPPALAPGTYPASLAAVTYAGNKTTVRLAPLVVAWDTSPPAVAAQLSGTTLSWQGTDPGTPWLVLKIDLVDPAAVNPPQTLELGQQALSGSVQVSLPPGAWQATLQAANSAGLTASVDLGAVSASG